MSLKVVRIVSSIVIALALAWPSFPVFATNSSDLNAAIRWVNVTSPNGGELMIVGDVYRITWQTSANIDKVSIGYKSCYSCLTWIVTSIPNKGYYDWTVNVGNTTKTQFTIQITGYQTGVGSTTDYSDSFFTVLPKPTPTRTPTKTRTPTRTATSTKTPWPSKTPTSSKTPTPTDTPTDTPTPILLPLGDGSGLVGEYFDNSMDMNGAPLYTRLDPQVNYYWDDNSPIPDVIPNDFSVRWVGQIEARSSEDYSLAMNADDIVRMWIDGQIYIDDWDNPVSFPVRIGPPISLVRGQKYDIQIDFRDTGGGASAELYWNTLSGSIDWETIPSEQLYPSTGGLPATATPTHTLTPTPTDKPTGTPTNTATSTNTHTITATATSTWTRTSTNTRTNTATSTNTHTITATATSTWTRTSTNTRTNTATRTNTPTFTATATNTPTDTATATNTRTDTATPTPTDTPTETPTITNTATATPGRWVQVISPNGGEVLGLGETYRIKWDSSPDIESVWIMLKDCPSCGNWIATSLPNNGYFDWTVSIGSPLITRQFTIMVYGYKLGVGFITDESDSAFTVICPPTPTATPIPWISLIAPNGGEVLTVGDTYRIMWDSSPEINSVSIRLLPCPSCGNGFLFNSLPNTGYVDWNVWNGNSAGTQFRIEIQGYSSTGGSPKDQSDSTFTILPKPTSIPTETLTSSPTSTVDPNITLTIPPTPTQIYTPTSTNIPLHWITVTSPNGGEELTLGDVYRITWQSSSNIPQVGIWIGYRCKGCSTYGWNYLLGLYPIDNTGFYDWTVLIDDPTNKEFAVNVTGIGDSGLILAEDYSDGPFTVVNPNTPTPTATSTDNICIAINADVEIVDDQFGYLAGDVNVGDEISGMYIYDLYSPDEIPDPSTGRYHFNGDPAEIILNVEGLTFRTMQNSVNIWFELVNDTAYPSGDSYKMESFINNFDISVSPDANNMITWQLDDPTGTALSSDSLPTAPPDLSNWQSPEGLKIYSSDYVTGEGFTIVAQVTSSYPCGQIPTVVPTPSPTPEWPLPIIIIKPVDGEILAFGEISQIVWEASSEMPYVYMELVSRCKGCAESNWEQEIDWGLSSNSGDMQWVVLVNEPLNKEYAVHIEGRGNDGITVTGEGLTGPFYIAYDVMPTVPITTLLTPFITSTPTPTLTTKPTDTETPTPTSTPAETPTFTPTHTPTITMTPTVTATPSRTPTLTVTPTSTWTVTNTRTPRPPTDLPVPTDTLTP